MKAKQIISCILMLLMLVSLMPAGFADITWSNNTTQVNPGGFTVVDPDAGNEPAPQAESSSGGHTHNWQNLKTEKEATCTSYGMATQVCYDCGATQTVYTDMLPHTWSEWEITIYATDHTAGEKQRTCEVCGKVDIQKYYLEGTVLPGSTGEEVLELQDLLNQNGIPAPRDGEYGDATREAVREAQQRNGYEVDGIAWLQTVNCLRHRFGDWEVVQEGSLTKPRIEQRICEICGYVETDEYYTALGPGARGDGVKELQELLEALGYYNGRRDGDYGQAVAKAVGDAQEDGGFERTGIADEEFLDWLYNQYINRKRPTQPEEDDGTVPVNPADRPTRDAEEPGLESKVSPEHAGPMASASLYFGGQKITKANDDPNSYETKKELYEAGKILVPGDEIKWTLYLENTGEVAITAGNGAFLSQKNYDNDGSGTFSCDTIAPGGFKAFYNACYRETSYTGSFMGGTHKITQEDLEHGEFADFAYCNVVFENGDLIHLNAEIHFTVGGESNVSAKFTVEPSTVPKNGLFFTEDEKIDYFFELTDTCSYGLNYKVYSATYTAAGKKLENLFGSHYYAPVTGYLNPMSYYDFNPIEKELPHTVTAEDCDKGYYQGAAAVAHCTFDNGEKRSYMAVPTFPCGIENPGAEVKIVETSQPKDNKAYYTLGETITYDVVLTNTGNLTMSTGYVYMNREGAAPLFLGDVNYLAPGESVTIVSWSEEVTKSRLEKETLDVSVYADCLFIHASFLDTGKGKGDVELTAEDAKSFPIGGKPSALLNLTRTNLPGNGKYIEDETVAYITQLVNTGDIELTGATLKVSYNNGAAEDLATIPSLAPGMSDSIPFAHTVTNLDAQNNTLECLVTGECTFADGTVLTVSENDLADIGNPALKVDIVVSSTAPDGFYKRNDSVAYQVTVSNIGNMDFESVRATVLPADGEKGYAYVLQMDGFAAGASETRPHTYTVTMDDVASGSVAADAEAFGVLPSGKEVTASASVSVPTGMLPVNLSVEKVVTSTSTYSFYEENDTITYSITVTNNGKEAIPSVDVTDNSPAGMTVLGTISEMAPGASISYPYTYTVTGADVTAGNVHNIGEIDAVLPDGTGYSATSEVDSATGKYVPPVPPTEPDVNGENEDKEGTGPVVWYLHETVTDGVRSNALDQGIEMSITLYEDGRAEIEVNKETTPAFWTEDEETITVTAEEKENLYVKVEDTLENDQEGTLMIFRREKPEPSIKE